MNNLSNLGVNELKTQEIKEINGGNVGLDYLLDYVVGKVIEVTIDAAIDHCNKGAGYGGWMDRHGKL